MSLTLVQSATESTGNVANPTVTFPSNPTVGNLLVFYLMCGGNTTTITPPTGVTLAVESVNSTTNALKCDIYYAVVDSTLAAQTAYTFTFSAGHTQTLQGEEWSSTTGWAASPLDKTATADNGAFAATTAMDTGATATTAQASELWAGMVAYKAGNQSPSGATSGWTISNNLSNGTANSAVMVNQVASATGAARWQGTLATAELIAGVVATFKPNLGTVNQASAAWTGTATVVATAAGATAYQATAAFSGSATLQGNADIPFRPVIRQTGGIKVVLAGQDITQFTDESTIDLTLALAQGPGVGSGGAGRTTQFKIRTRLGPAPRAKGAGQGPFSGTDLVRLGELVIYDATGSKVFGGYVVDLDDQTTTLEVQTDLTVTDYWDFLDRIIVNEVYAGYSDTQIIKDLLTKYAPWVNQALIPATNQYVFPKRFFRARTLREAIQVVADVTGYNVWIDANRTLHYASLASLSTAPISLSDIPDYIQTFPHTVTKYTVDDASVVNQVYFYGGKNTSADFVQDLSVQANGASKTFSLLYFPHDAGDGKIHITKNGVDLVQYSTYDTDPTHALISKGGTADVLLNRDAETLQFDTAPLKTDTLTCTYRYQTPLVLVLTSTKSYQKFGNYFQAKVVDQNVFDAQTALQRCRVLLAQQSDGLTTLQVKTWKAGVQPGQLLYIKNTTRGIDGTFQVQKVQMKPLGAGFFEWTVDLGAWNWNLIDVLIWQTRTADATDDSVEENESVIQAQEKVVGSTVTVAWTKKTATSGQYFSRTTAAGDGQDAYSGFFSVTS